MAEARALARRTGLVVITAVDAADARSQALLMAAGYTPSRREAVVELPIRPALVALGGVQQPAGIEVRSALEVDADSLRLLDDELRQDVPGTAGWRNDPSQFDDDTFGDPEFDPRTYLIAVEAATGEYAGLVRVWMRQPQPRIGLIGVCRAYRRRGIASALLFRALEATAAAGASVVTTEFDMSNTASRTLFERLGAWVVGESVELSLLARRRSTGDVE